MARTVSSFCAELVRAAAENVRTDGMQARDGGPQGW